MKLINEAEVFDTWAPMLEEQTGIKESEKLGWMTKYCHYHSLNEAFTYPAAGLLNTPGMGNVSPAGAAAPCRHHRDDAARRRDPAPNNACCQVAVPWLW